jgi:hypothetical protein
MPEETGALGSTTDFLSSGGIVATAPIPWSCSAECHKPSACAGPGPAAALGNLIVRRPLFWLLFHLCHKRGEIGGEAGYCHLAVLTCTSLGNNLELLRYQKKS